MRPPFRAALIAVLIAACGSGPTATPPATPPASQIVSSSGDVDAAFADAVHAFPELEQLLPETIDGVELEHWSLAGAEPADPDELFAAQLEELARRPADLQLAFGTAVDDNSDLYLVAARIVGVDGDELGRMVGQEFAAGWSSRTIGDRAVLVEEGASDSVSYIYRYGDVVFFIAGRPDLADAALRALPPHVAP